MITDNLLNVTQIMAEQQMDASEVEVFIVTMLSEYLPQNHSINIFDTDKEN